MGKAKWLGEPINFFTDLSYENYVDDIRLDPETYLGEEHSEIHYGYKDLKTGNMEYGVAFNFIPYAPAEIPAVKHSLNVDELGEGDYAINRSISYDACLQVFNEMLDKGVPITDITADTIKNELQQGYKKVA